MEVEVESNSKADVKGSSSLPWHMCMAIAIEYSRLVHYRSKRSRKMSMSWCRQSRLFCEPNRQYQRPEHNPKARPYPINSLVDPKCCIFMRMQVRDKFAELTQKATVLSLEAAEEIMEYWGDNAGPMNWRLSANDIRAVLRQREDFMPDDIAGLLL